MKEADESVRSTSKEFPSEVGGGSDRRYFSGGKNARIFAEAKIA